MTSVMSPVGFEARFIGGGSVDCAIAGFAGGAAGFFSGSGFGTAAIGAGVGDGTATTFATGSDLGVSVIAGAVGSGLGDGNEKVMTGADFGGSAMMWPCRITRLPVRWATVGPRSSHRNTSGHAKLPLMNPMSTAAAAVVQRGNEVNQRRRLRVPVVAA